MEPPSRPFRAAHALHPSPPPISAFRAVPSPSPIRVQLTSSRRVSDQRPSATQPRSKVRSTQPNRSSGYAPPLLREARVRFITSRRHRRCSCRYARLAQERAPPLPQQTATPSTHTLRASAVTSPHLLNGSSSRHHCPLRVSAPSPPLTRRHRPAQNRPRNIPELSPYAPPTLRPAPTRTPRRTRCAAPAYAPPTQPDDENRTLAFSTPRNAYALVCSSPLSRRRPNRRPAIPRSVSTTTLRAARQPTTSSKLAFSTRATPTHAPMPHRILNTTAHPRRHLHPLTRRRPPHRPPSSSPATRHTTPPERRETTPDPPVPQNHLTPPTYPHPRAARNPRAREAFRRRISPPPPRNNQLPHLPPYAPQPTPTPAHTTRHNQLPHLHHYAPPPRNTKPRLEPPQHAL